MVLYVSTILICMTLIGLANYFIATPIFGFEVWYIILGVTVSTVAVIVIDGIFATLVRWAMPEKWFSVDKKCFVPSKKKCHVYEKLGIKKWKDKVLELGGFSGFHKDKLGDATNNEYVVRFIVEANYGILVHIACIIFGFAVVFVFPLKYWLCFGIPVAVVNAVL
ncbi:MAG: hypothetical protein IJX16_00845, partial [Clostridia bacterium]|nr:hypothetical protein [Clostridia bacterium]